MFLTVIAGICILFAEIDKQGLSDKDDQKLFSELASKRIEALEYLEGQLLFSQKCKSCHNFFRPHGELFVVSLRNEFWGGGDKIATFLRQPGNFVNVPYIMKTMETYGIQTPHVPFRRITDDQVRMIYRYIMIESEKNGF